MSVHRPLQTPRCFSSGTPEGVVLSSGQARSITSFGCQGGGGPVGFGRCAPGGECREPPQLGLPVLIWTAALLLGNVCAVSRSLRTA
jgi:hypothetical protein